MYDTGPEYLKAILTGIVASPEAIVITETTDDLGVLLTLALHKDDMGRVIGKEGETAKAIRRLLKAHGHARKQNLSMKILEPA